MEPRQCAHLRVREEAPGCGARWRLSRLLSGSVGTSFAMTAHAFSLGCRWSGCDVGGVAHGHYGTGLISRATAEMLREKHVRRRAGVAWGNTEAGGGFASAKVRVSAKVRLKVKLGASVKFASGSFG